MVVLSVRGGSDLKLVLGQVNCGFGVGKVDGDIDQVGSLGPENYMQLNNVKMIALVIMAIPSRPVLQ